MTTDTERKAIRRRFKLGTMDREAIFIDARIDRELSRDHDRLSICGSIYRSGHDVGGGQIRDVAREVYQRGHLAIPYQQARKLVEVWERWHLNDMRSGCEHQRNLGWVRYDDHPSEPCPVCGYKFGSAWLVEELPDDVYEFIASLPSA